MYMDFAMRSIERLYLLCRASQLYDRTKADALRFASDLVTRLIKK